jgi:hypothetical protein
VRLTRWLSGAARSFINVHEARLSIAQKVS